MAWYAIRTIPGAQKPQRRFDVQITKCGRNGRPRGKGYRITPSLDPNISAVERALGERGFTYYMPAEKRLVRDRRHTDLWKARRFALMVGYVFVRDPHDFWELEECPGVLDIVKTVYGEPLEILLEDILMVRAAEAAAEVEFDKQSRNARQMVRKLAKTDPRLKMLAEKLDIAGEISVPLSEVA